jgi:hypothetical protein
MSIKINVNMKRTLTETVSGTFTTNHTEDEVIKWIKSGGIPPNSLGCYDTSDESEWRINSLEIQPFVKGEIYKKQGDLDFKFDDDIQESIHFRLFNGDEK